MTEIALEGKDGSGQEQNVLLKTESADHIPGFILANSFCRSCGCAPAPLGCECETPNHLPVFPREAEGSREGESLVICGAGPSLEGVGDLLADHDGEVWACNSALNWLTEHGHRATHGVAIDASTRMFGEVWTEPTADVEYYLATTVNPGLTDHLHDAGCRIRQFHSLRGKVEDETTLYALLYPPTVLTGHGLNVVNRALDLAGWLGFGRIRIIGADSAMRGRQMYADGRQYGEQGEEWWVEGTIDGVMWKTKPDMLMSAVSLVRARRELGPGRVEFVGDVLPRALQDKDDAFLDRCIEWNDWETTEEQAQKAGIRL